MRISGLLRFKDSKKVNFKYIRVFKYQKKKILYQKSKKKVIYRDNNVIRRNKGNLISQHSSYKLVPIGEELFFPIFV